MEGWNKLKSSPSQTNQHEHGMLESENWNNIGCHCLEKRSWLETTLQHEQQENKQTALLRAT